MIAMAGLQSSGDTFNEAFEKRIENGQDRESARQSATADGLIAGFTTALVTAAFGKTGKEVITAVRSNAQAKGALVKIIKESGLEASEEMVDQVLQAVREVMTYRPEMTMQEAVKDVMMAGAGGLVAGGGVISVIETSRLAQEGQTERRALKGFQKEISRLVEFGPEAQFVDVPMRGPLGQEVTIKVPVQPSPVRGTTREALPPVAGIEGAQAVDQALSVGLPRTANELAKQIPIPPPIDLTPGQELGTPQLPPQTAQQAAARQVAEQITPGAPVPASTPVTQPTPQADVAAAPVVTPEAAQGAPGVSPAPAPTPAPAVTRESISSPTPAPVQSEQAIGLKTNLAREYPQLNRQIEVVESGEEFPANIKQDLARKKIETGDVDAVFHNGRVIFNASKFPVGDPSLVREKVTHEVAVHLGLRRALGAQKFTDLTRSIWNNLSPNDRATIAARNRINPEDIFQIGEEWLAYEAERVVRLGTTTTMWSRIASSIRAGLRRLGFKRKYTDVEIAQMVEKGLRAAEVAPTDPQSTAERPGRRTRVSRRQPTRPGGHDPLQLCRCEANQAGRCSRIHT